MKGNFTQLLFCCLDQTGIDRALVWAKQCRDAGIKTELYPGTPKLKKQLDYANSKNINYVAIIGEEEMQSGVLSFKDMISGEQQKLSIDQLITSVLK